MGGLYKFYKEATSLVGSLSFNTDDIRGQCNRIFVKPPSDSVSFDIVITNDNGLDIYSRQGITGVLNDVSNQPMKGIHTVSFTNISTDGLFKTEFSWEEKM
jgi:hypothetical protein